MKDDHQQLFSQSRSHGFVFGASVCIISQGCPLKGYWAASSRVPLRALKPSRRGNCTSLAAWILRWSETAGRPETPAGTAPCAGARAPQLDLLTAKALQKASRTPDSSRVSLPRVSRHPQTRRRSPVYISTTGAANAARPGIYRSTSLVQTTSSHRGSGFKESCPIRMLFRTISVNLR